MRLSDVNVTPLYDTFIPSTKKRVKFRPFNIQEERALLTAHESEDTSVMINTLNQVVKNCVTPTPTTLASFDLEYLFVQIRAKSVGEISTLIFTCTACNEGKIPVEINLGDVHLIEDPAHANKMSVSDTIVVQLKYPSVESLIDIESIKDEEESKFRAVCASVETIFVGDEVIEAKDETPEAITKFINTLTSKQYKPLTTFFDTMPEVAATVKFRCPKCKAENEKVIKGLNNFFS